MKWLSSSALTISPVVFGVEPLPGLSATSLGLGVEMALVDTTVLLASGSETAEFPVLVHGLCNPADAGIAADGLVLRVDKDDLIVLVGRILVDPVRVENAQVGAAAADALLSNGAEGALELELVHTTEAISTHFGSFSGITTYPWLVGLP